MIPSENISDDQIIWRIAAARRPLSPDDLTVAALAVAGVFAGPAGTGTEPATAAVIHRTIEAMSLHRGTILLEREIYSSNRGPAIHQTQLTETPTGPGAQSTLLLTDDPHFPAGMAVTGGQQSVYARRTNTIDVTSIWGPYLRPGARPGTFVYDPTARGAPTYGHAPLTVSARQARLLREGIDQIRVGAKGVGLRVTSVFHFPSVLGTYRTLIAEHAFRLVGTVTIDGRHVIEFSGGPWRPDQVRRGGSDPHDVGGETIYLNAATHLPYKDVISRNGQKNTVTYTQFQRLPITGATQRLLSLKAHFPSAKIAHSHAGYLRAAGGASDYTGQ